MKKFFDIKVLVTVLAAMVVYELVIKNLVSGGDTYEYDGFQGENDGDYLIVEEVA